MIVWGTLCVAVIFIVYNPLCNLMDKIPVDIQKTVSIIMAVLLIIDLAITVVAILRYSARHSGQEAFTAFGQFADKFFNDAFMAERFPKLNFI